MKSKLLFGAVAALLLAGAAAAEPDATNATTSGDQAAQASPSQTPAAKPASAGAIDIPAPPEGKGQIVFFRKSAFQGAAVWFNVRENGSLLGKLSNGAYFIQVTDPGQHTYTAATENKDTLHLEVDPGETYFVEGRVTMGFMVGEANLAPSDQATFDKVSKHLHLAKAPPADTAAGNATKP